MMDESVTALTIRWPGELRQRFRDTIMCVRVCKNDPYSYIAKEADLGWTWASGLCMEVSLLAMVTSRRWTNNHESQGVQLSAQGHIGA